MIMSHRLRYFVSCFLTVVFVASLSAQVVYDEALDGDLSDLPAAPTVVTLSPGSNIIRGTTGFDPVDRDIWTFTLPAGQSLASIIVDTHITSEDQSFLAVESGSMITDIGTSDNLLGATLFGSNPGQLVGDDILDDLGMANIGGAGFTPPLSSGTYTFWYQETADDTEFAFNFQVVPEPSSMVLVVFSGLGLVLMRRRS